MIARYLRLSIWPSGLVVDYGTPRALGLVDVAPYALLVVTLALLTVWAMARKPQLGFLGLWFFTTLSPTSSFVPIASEVGAERRMYLPLAAIVMLAVVGAAWLLERWAQRSGLPARAHAAGMAVLAAAVVVLGAATIVRNREFASAVTLARVTYERWPNARTQHSLGVALVADRQYEAGIRELRQAVEGEPAAHYTLGVALYQQGKLDEAIVHLREFLARESLRIEVPAAHELIGRALMSQGRFAEAQTELEHVLRMNPSNVEAQRLLAEVLLRQEKFDEAAQRYEQYLAARPADAAALMELGVAHVALGRHDEAIARFRRAVELVPQDGMAHRNLARALLTKGAYDDAANHARQATLLRPDDPVAHDQLGVALAGQGRLDEALRELQRAVQLDPSDSEARAHLEVVQQAKQTTGARP
jgi:tetratricopeptide (TPR) repeat protein